MAMFNGTLSNYQRVEDFQNLLPVTAGYRKYQGTGSAIPTTSAGIPAGMQWSEVWRRSNPRQGLPVAFQRDDMKNRLKCSYTSGVIKHGWKIPYELFVLLKEYHGKSMEYHRRIWESR